MMSKFSQKVKDLKFDLLLFMICRGILRVSGKRKVDLQLRIISDETAASDKEYLLFNNLIIEVKKFLSKKYSSHSKVLKNSLCSFIFDPLFQFLPIAECVDIQTFQSSTRCCHKFFILENKNHMGFKRDLMQHCEGLDYEHSVLGTISNFMQLCI